MRDRLTHADERSTVVERDAIAEGVCALADDRGESGVKGLGESDVADPAVFEECPAAYAFGAVDDLVGQKEVAGADVLLEGADGGEGDDCADAQRA